MKLDCSSSEDEELSPIIDTQRAKRRKSVPQPVYTRHDQSYKSFYINESPLMKDASMHMFNTSFIHNRSKCIIDTIEREGDNILCIVISTFSIDLEYMMIELPQLFGIHSVIPTIIMYGKQSENTQRCINTIPLSSLCNIFFVSPQYKSNSVMGIATDPGAILGVHHPKYVLIYTSKGLYISVSTANMTYELCYDSTWTHFFPALLSHSNNKNIQTHNDFGIVLQNFVNEQSNQSTHMRHNRNFEKSGTTISVSGSDPLSPLQLISNYTKCDDITTKYDFSNAEVDLITTVPGRYRLQNMSYTHSDSRDNLRMPCINCVKERAKLSATPKISSYGVNNITYGSARIHDVLTHRSQQLPRMLNHKDTLFIQPTSIGNGIQNSFISDYLSMLMPESIWDEESQSTALSDDESHVRLECCRILWPTSTFMSQCGKDTTRLLKETSTKKDNQDLSSSSTTIHERFLSGNGLFFLPNTLALMEPDIQSQLYQYCGLPLKKRVDVSPIDSLELNTSEVKEFHISPHIKSYFRLLSNELNSIQNSSDIIKSSTCSCHDIAWYLLSSSCLSKGAQGSITRPCRCNTCGNSREGYIEFKNFEIGVLFHSDYTDKRKRYKLLSMSCDVHGDSSSSHENLELNLGGYAQYLGHCKLDSDTILPYDIDEVIHSKTSKGLGCSDCIILPVPFDPLSSECKSFYDDELHCDMEHICNSNSENNLVSCISTSSRSTSIQSSYSISNKQKSIPYFTDFRQMAASHTKPNEEVDEEYTQQDETQSSADG